MAQDAGQGSQGRINVFSRWEELGYIRLQQDEIGAARVARGVFPTDAAAEVIFSQHVSRALSLLLHIVFFPDG